MLISVRDLVRCWSVAPSGVLHVGAHEAEELDDYRGAEWGHVYFVEALPDKAKLLRERFAESGDVTVLEAAAWDEDGIELSFNVASNGQSSSAFAFGTHKIYHPEIVFTHEILVTARRLDSLLGESHDAFDYVSLVVQGAELRALRGLGDRLDAVRWVYSEVNAEPVYEGGATITDLDAFLAARGFVRIDTAMTTYGWGDALYAREDVAPTGAPLRRCLRRARGFCRRYVG